LAYSQKNSSLPPLAKKPPRPYLKFFQNNPSLFPKQPFFVSKTTLLAEHGYFSAEKFLVLGPSASRKANCFAFRPVPEAIADVALRATGDRQVSTHSVVLETGLPFYYG